MDEELKHSVGFHLPLSDGLFREQSRNAVSGKMYAVVGVVKRKEVTTLYSTMSGY
jgi:hypothetical protein